MNEKSFSTEENTGRPSSLTVVLARADGGGEVYSVDRVKFTPATDEQSARLFLYTRTGRYSDYDVEHLRKGDYAAVLQAGGVEVQRYNGWPGGDPRNV